jgi:hypothetical protein
VRNLPRLPVVVFVKEKKSVNLLRHVKLLTPTPLIPVATVLHVICSSIMDNYKTVNLHHTVGKLYIHRMHTLFLMFLVPPNLTLSCNFSDRKGYKDPITST